MKRRSTFKIIGAGILATAISTCQEVFGEISRFRWPGYPSKSALKKHMLHSSKHSPLSDAYVNSLKTFQELIDAHDLDHARRRKDKAPYGSGRTVPNTKSGRGESSVDRSGPSPASSSKRSSSHTPKHSHSKKKKLNLGKLFRRR